MKRIRRVSIEVERREITLYATSSSWSSPDGETAPSANSALVVPETGTISEELATALKEGRVHLHQSAGGQLIVCNRKDCNE
jgi:hypothetical protein